MNSEIYEALALLEKERGIPVDFMLDRIRKAILTACKSSYNGNEDAIINMDPATGAFEVYLRKTVVEDVADKGREISLADARAIDPNAAVDEKVSIPLDTKEFGRIAAQTARNIIRQGIRDGERGQVMQEFQSRHQELVSALVERIDPRSGAATLRIGKAEAVLPKSEQVGDEELKEGDHVKVYVVDVKETEKGPRAVISRTHPDLVKRLFETEVPEIYDGTVEISRSPRGGFPHQAGRLQPRPPTSTPWALHRPARRRASVRWSMSSAGKDRHRRIQRRPCKFIASALSPADVLGVESRPRRPALLPRDRAG